MAYPFRRTMHGLLCGWNWSLDVIISEPCWNGDPVSEELQPWPLSQGIHEDPPECTPSLDAVARSANVESQQSWEDWDLPTDDYGLCYWGDLDQHSWDPARGTTCYKISRRKPPQRKGRSCGRSISACIAIRNEQAAKKNWQFQKLPTTCSWLNESRQVKEWLDVGEKSSLWLCGQKGSGKSVLCASLLDHLYSAPCRIGSRHVFWSFQELALGEDDARHLLTTLLRQLMGTIIEEPQKIRLSHMLQNVLTSNDKITQHAFKKYLAVVLQSAQEHTQMLLVVDGLSDEYWIAATLSEEVAAANQTRQRGNQHKCALFCRTTSADARKMHRPYSITINLDNEQGLRHDLHLFQQACKRKATQSQLIQSSSSTDKPHTFLIEATKASFGNWSRMFATTIQANASVTNLYEMGLKSIVPASRPIVRRMYAWVIAAARPLTLEELLEALAIQSDGQGLCGDAPALPTNSCISDLENQIVEISGGLLVVDQQHLVSFVHHSAKEFIVATSGSKDFSSSTHLFAAENCLKYLCNIDREAVPSRSLLPLASTLRQPFEAYARAFWHWHSKFAGIRDKRLLAMIDHYLRMMSLHGKSRRSSASNSACANDLREPTFEVTGVQPSPDSMLALSSFLGFEPLVEMYLQAGASVNGCCTVCPTPLQLAARMRHVHVVEHLVRKHASMISNSSPWPDPLYMAASLDFSDITETLLHHSDDIINALYERALQIASFRGHAETVKVMLEGKGAPCDQEKFYGNAVQAACYNGHHHVVELFLNVGARVNVSDPHYGTPLQAASSQGHQKVVHMLLRMGAEVDVSIGDVEISTRDDSRPPTENFSKAPRKTTAGATRRIFDTIGKSDGERDDQPSLHLAAAHGHTQIVETLINDGVKVDNTLDKSQETPLHLAAAQGHLLTAKLLTTAFGLAKAQNIYFQMTNQDYYRSWCRDEIVEQGCQHRHVWDLDSREAAEDTLEDFKKSLRSSSYLNLKVASGRTALHLAAANGHHDVIRHLLECGASVETQDNHGYTPLQSAAENGHLLAVESLLMAGAQIKYGDTHAHSPLLLAARNKHYETAELLLFYSFSIEVTGSDLRSATLGLIIQRAQSVARDLLCEKFGRLDA